MTDAAATGRVFTKDGKPWPSWKLQPPPEGSPGVGTWCWSFYEKLRRHRDKQGLPVLWARYHELYRGKIFQRRGKYGKVIANLVFKNINALKNNITDNKPRVSIVARGETNSELAKVFQADYDNWWDARKQQDALAASVGRSETMGFQTDQMQFNPMLEGGSGEIETRRWDTYGVLFYPGHIEVQSQPGMVVYEALEIGEIYSRWPEAEGQVRADREYSELMAEERRFVRGNRGKDLRPMGYAATYVVPGEDGTVAPADARYATERALVVHAWVKDYTEIWVDPRTGEPVKGENAELLDPVIDPETGQPLSDPDTGEMFMQVAANPETGEPLKPEKWAKYPGYIRCVSVTNGGKLVLSDLPNPSINPELPREVASNTYLWDKFPFIKRLSISDDMSEYGLSIIEQIESLVVELCKKLTQYGVHLDTLCRNPLILPKGCGVDEGQVNTLPKRIWRPVVSMAPHIKFLEIPSAPQDILTFIELVIRLIDMVTGITDVSEGRRPGDVTAYRAIAALQEKAQTVFRDKIRHNDTYLEEQGRMYISLRQNWDIGQRLLTYKNEFGEEVTVPFRGIDSQGEFAFHVEAGSTLPQNRNVRQAQVVEIAKAKPNFPDETLLEEMGFPDAQKIARQMQAGPLGMIMDRIKRSQLVDDATLQTLENLAKMTPQEFAKNFGSGNPLDIAGNQG